MNPAGEAARLDVCPVYSLILLHIESPPMRLYLHSYSVGTAVTVITLSQFMVIDSFLIQSFVQFQSHPPLFSGRS